MNQALALKEQQHPEELWVILLRTVHFPIEVAQIVVAYSRKNLEELSVPFERERWVCAWQTRNKEQSRRLPTRQSSVDNWDEYEHTYQEQINCIYFVEFIKNSPENVNEWNSYLGEDGDEEEMSPLEDRDILSVLQVHHDELHWLIDIPIDKHEHDRILTFLKKHFISLDF